MLGKLLVVKFELGQQSMKLMLFGISKACDVLSLERLILILCWWISYAIGYLCKDAWFLDGCKHRVESVFVWVSVVVVKSSLHLCEPETRFFFPKWQESEATPCGDVMLQEMLRRTRQVCPSDSLLPGYCGVERLIILLIWFILSLTCGAEMKRWHVLKCHGIGCLVRKHVWHNYGIMCLMPCITSDHVGVTNFR
jgi:hypothetical protein